MSLGYITHRAFQLLLTVLATSVLVFIMMRVVPGDPVANLAIEGGISPDQAAYLRSQLGLDLPIWQQYLDWLRRALQGDLGVSLRYRAPVSELIWGAFPRTLILAVFGMLGALLVTFPLVAIGTIRPRGLINRLVTVWSVVAGAVPGLSLGVAVLLLFSVQLGWLPSINHPVLPVAVIAFNTAGDLMRTLRNGLFAELGVDYVRTARSKGLDERRIRLRHVLPNVLTTFITVAALGFANILTGALVIETLFAWPGVGMLVVDAIKSRDYPMVQALVMLFAVVFCTINFLADLSYGLVDPRIRDNLRNT